MDRNDEDELPSSSSSSSYSSSASAAVAAASCESCVADSKEEITSRESQLNPLQKLSESDDLLIELKHLFHSNLGKTFPHRCPVLSVYKNLHSSGSARSRLRAFEASAESIGRKRGNANIKKAWFSCSSKAETLRILSHGFDRTETYFFPLDNPIDGVLSATPDGSGHQYMILCSVILGRTKEIRFRVLSPSSDEFDSEVADKEIPKKYFIWPALVNSRVCPLYVLLVKPDFRRRELVRVMGPTSPWISLSKLVNVLRASLTPEKSKLIKRAYVEFMERKISRKEMISRVRALSGDELLRTSIRLFGSKITRDDIVPQMK